MEVAHGRELDQLEARALDALLALYGDLQNELAERLRAAVDGGYSFTAQHLAAISAQVGGALEHWAQASAEAMGEQVSQTVPVGARQVAREILRAEELTDPAGEVVARLREWAPQIPVAQAAELAQGQGLIIRRTSDEVRESIGKALAKAVASGEGMDAAARRLRASLQEETWRLARVARTEINNAANLGHEASLTQAANCFPGLGLQKKWSAARDGRTSDTCRSLDGQVRDTEQAFEGARWSGQRPPAHPNCRSRVVPWSGRWVSPSQSGAEGLSDAERAFVVQAREAAHAGPVDFGVEEAQVLGRWASGGTFRSRMTSRDRGDLPLGDRVIRRGDVVSSLDFHLAKRISQGQWAPDATPEQFLSDIQASLREGVESVTRNREAQQNGGEGAAVLTFTCRNLTPQGRRGPGATDRLVVVVAVTSGKIKTGFCVSPTWATDRAGD